jgi:polygalacturonase
VDNILFEQVRMKDIKVPLVINALYFCDPDGHSAWVQSREHEAVDESTPRIGSIRFERVKATGCQGCVAYVLGLPEQPVEELAIRDSTFDFAEDAAEMREPAMAEGVDPVRKRGLILKFAQRVELTGIRVSGAEGPLLDLQEVQEIIQ